MKKKLGIYLIVIIFCGCKSNNNSSTVSNYPFLILDKSKSITKQEYIDYQQKRGSEITFFDFRTSTAVFDRESFSKYYDYSVSSLESEKQKNEGYVYFKRKDNNSMLREVSRANFSSKYIDGKYVKYLRSVITKYYYKDPFDNSSPSKDFTYEELKATLNKINDTINLMTKRKPTYCSFNKTPYGYHYDDNLKVINVKTESGINQKCFFWPGYEVRFTYSIYSNFQEEQENTPVKKERMAIYVEQYAKIPEN